MMLDHALAYSDPRMPKHLFVDGLQDLQRIGTFVQKAGYWQPDSRKGCGIGASICVINNVLGTKHYHHDHSAMAKTLRVPVSLVYMSDVLFDEMPSDAAQAWPVRFAAAIPAGYAVANVTRHAIVNIIDNMLAPTIPPSNDEMAQALYKTRSNILTGSTARWSRQQRHLALVNLDPRILATHAASQSVGGDPRAYMARFLNFTAAAVCENPLRRGIAFKQMSEILLASIESQAAQRIQLAS